MTYTSQDSGSIFISRKVFLRDDELVLHVGHVDANLGHLSGHVIGGLLTLVFLLLCLCVTAVASDGGRRAWRLLRLC